MLERSQRVYTLSTSRIAILSMFFINGATFANWVTRIPQIRANLGLTEGTLGLALLGVSVGVIVGLLMAGGLIARYSSKAVTTAAAILFSLTLPVVGMAFNFWSLFLILAIAGYFGSIMDMAMNTQAAELERRINRPVMSSFHAAFSIGGVAGALMGAVASRLDLSVFVHFAGVAGFFVVLALLSMPPLIQIMGETEQGHTSVLNFPPRILWWLGAVAFCSTIGEGSMGDWSALYLHETVLTSESIAALGYAAYSGMMTAGRVAGDWLAARYQPDRLVQAGGLIASAGLLLALLVPQIIPVLIGFALVGTGLSIIVPLVFSAAGNMPGISSGTGIAGVATIGYAGFLAGPPIIGLLAEATSLRFALGVVFLMIATLILSGRSLRLATPIT